MQDNWGFGGTIRSLKRAADAARSVGEAQQEPATSTSDERLKMADAVLTFKVRPVLEQAKAIFDVEGVASEIVGGGAYEANTRRPLRYLSFRCFDPTDPQGNLRPNMAPGGTVRFEHDGENLAMKASWMSIWAPPIRGEPGGLAAHGAKEALADHFGRHSYRAARG